MKLLLVSVLLGSMLGCSTVIPKELDPKIYYKNDMILTVDGQSFSGVGIVKKNLQYKIRIESRQDVDLLTITSCHRQISVESAIKVGWFKLKRAYEFTYNPDDIEQDGSCLLRFGAYNKDTGQHSWAMLDFHGEESLPAQYSCDGYFYSQIGVGICQSHQGLIQSIVFSSPVRIAAGALSNNCRIPEPADKMHWTFPLPNRECVIAFQEISAEHRIHRATLIGYEQPIVRGQQ